MNMRELVDKEIRDLYIKHLHEPMAYHGGGARAKHPHMYEKILPADSILNGGDVDIAKVWTWGDQHFWHKNIIGYSDRPFRHVEEMHQQLLANYKMCVGPDDICVWVGDVAFAKDTMANAMLSAYPGYKILVVGNHDFGRRKELRGLEFDEIHLTLTVEAAEDLFLAFTHFPLENKLPHPFFTDMRVEVYNIHGHTHDRNIPDPRLRNVSVENIDYCPDRLAELVLGIEKRVQNED